MEQVALVVGEALVDVVRTSDGPDRHHPGGSSANAAVALARLGRPVTFLTAFAQDDHGQLLAEHLRDNGVQVGGNPLALDRTATAVATVAESGAASYEFDVEWRPGPLSLPTGTDPVVVVFGSLGAALDPGALDVAALVTEHRAAALVVFDLNARPQVTGTGPEVVTRAEEMAALADVVKASDEDLDALWPGQEHREVAAGFLARGAGAVIVTRGGEGAAWFTASGEGEVPANRTPVVDTIGAGDTVTAAVVDALWSFEVVGPGARERLRDLGPTRWTAVLAHAARAAAVTVGRPGADPPRRSELS
ncbi:MAG: Ribokinase [Nocardioides sp.]|jgi:fructokinase|uniref:PfkB family carbohydrate kinase n=1 Tax=Nocardioides sp. TaxID=35761 RepID=UPI002605AC96|nr:PfkB family carbohydrate kinase [Nocardioides sp.]MCW2832774.1 Ribokinase [Nocardioides sp.]